MERSTIRNGNSRVVEHVHSIRSGNKERIINGFLESNSEEFWELVNGKRYRI